MTAPGGSAYGGNARTLRIHHFIPSTRANGPGLRAALWLQGCTLGCPGCFNPETHQGVGGQTFVVDELFKLIVQASDRIEGITISGGEPLQQPAPLAALIQRIREETSLSVVLFSGYSWDEIGRNARIMSEIVSRADVFIAGRYDLRQHVGRSLRGSQNKTIHFLTDRYRMEDMEAIPESEVIIAEDGSVIISGIDPLRW